MSATLPMTMGERLALARLEARITGADPAEIVVGDRHVVFDLLGCGEMGEVVRARDRVLKRDVVLKRLRADLSKAWTGPRGAERARVLGHVIHPNVVPVLDVVDDPLGVFVVTEYVDALDLRGWLDVRARPWPEVVDILSAAARGLAALHAAGLVHGDVKPDNVLIASDGTARVVDFGLAHPESRSGTGGYLAPEQYAGEPADAKSDQLAFCLTLFEALYSVRAVDARLVERLRVDPFAWSLRDRPRQTAVPRRIDAVIARGTARERSERYPSMEALIDALDNARRRDPPRRLVAAIFAVGLGAAIAATWLLSACAFDSATSPDSMTGLGSASELGESSSSSGPTTDGMEGTGSGETQHDPESTGNARGEEHLRNAPQADCDTPLWCFGFDVWDPRGGPIWAYECFVSSLTPPFALAEVNFIVPLRPTGLGQVNVEITPFDGALPGAPVFTEAIDVVEGSNHVVLGPDAQIDSHAFCVGLVAPGEGEAGSLGIAVDTTSQKADVSFVQSGACTVPLVDVMDLVPQAMPEGNWCIDVVVRE